MRGIDFAQYTRVPLANEWAAIERDGYADFVIIGIGDLNLNLRNLQLESALRRGHRPEGYIYLHMGTAERQMEEAIRNLEREGYDCPFLWPDIEETRGYAQYAVVESLTRCVNIGVAAGWSRSDKQGIYTGGWFWPNATGNSREFSDMALWTAYYNTDSNKQWRDEWPIDFDWFTPYGGWDNLPRDNRRDTRQYRGTYDLHGVNVDLNWRDDRWKGANDDMASIQDLTRIIEAATPDEREYLNAVLMQGKVPIYPLAPADHPTLGHVLHMGFYGEGGDDGDGTPVDREKVESIVRETLAGARLTLPE